jgi:predicted Zn-dependent protease
VALERAKQADQKSAQVRVALGQLHFKRGDFREAIAELKVAVELTPNDPLPVLLLSQAYAATGEAGHGAEAVGKALVTQPQSAPLHERMVEVSLLAGWPQKAIKSAIALRQINRLNPDYAYMHAVAMLASGLVLEARHILEDHPDHPVLHYDLALAQAKAGDKAGARVSAAKAKASTDLLVAELAGKLLEGLK